LNFIIFAENLVPEKSGLNGNEAQFFNCPRNCKSQKRDFVIFAIVLIKDEKAQNQRKSGDLPESKQ